MAEKGCGRDTPTRRSSFRKGLRDESLPREYLEALEQKRRQLDDSIHKYIASKEREYKQFEHDLRHQGKISGAAGEAHDAQLANGVAKRRTSSEATERQGSGDSTDGRESEMSAVDPLLSVGRRRELDSGQTTEPDDNTLQASLAEHRDPRAGLRRDDESTARSLSALSATAPRPTSLERATSAPATIDSPRGEADPTAANLPRAHSDLAIQAKAKRPAHLEQLSQRTSSSGSSADGKLASAMKSPTQVQSGRPKRKRVSLAVGNSIVAPSDNVPLALHHNTTASHSRTRFPKPESETVVLGEETSATEAHSVVQTTPVARVQLVVNGKPDFETNAEQPVTKSKKPEKAALVDPDGDLFDLDDSDSATHLEDVDGSDEEMSGIAGRVDSSRQREQPMALEPKEVYEYDTEAGLVSEPDSEQENIISHDSPRGAASSSQQPTDPGFRKPSVASDPVFMGSDYQVAERMAVEDEIYGSSYSRPPSKGSFVGGSLGESYMARHAQEMERAKGSGMEGHVRS